MEYELALGLLASEVALLLMENLYSMGLVSGFVAAYLVDTEALVSFSTRVINCPANKNFVQRKWRHSLSGSGCKLGLIARNKHFPVRK